jgi:hypothetical protein
MIHFPYWGRWYLWEMSLFVSVTGFLLALYAVVFRQGKDRFILLSMVVILLLLAMGSYMPWFSLLHTWLPGFNLFRGVSKFVFQASLFMILLSAMGLDCLIRDGLRKRWAVLSVLGAAAALSLIAGLAILQSSQTPSGFWADLMLGVFNTKQSYLAEGFYLNSLAILKAGEVAALALAVLSATCVVITAILFLRISSISRASLLVTLAVMELFAAGMAVRDTFRLSTAYPDELVALLNSRLGEHRIFNPYSPNLAMSMGWRDIWGYDPLLPRRYGEFMAWMHHVDISQIELSAARFQFHPLLRMLGCRYMLTAIEGNIALAELGGDIMPRAALIGQWAVEPDRDRAFAILGQPGFDPRRLVVLERDPNLPAVAGASNPGTVTVMETSPNHLTIKADVNSASILVVTDSFMEGWRIVPLADSVSGSYEIIPANYTLRGVPLVPGHHHFRMEYRPISFVIGVWLSLSGVVVWLAIAGIFVWRKRKRDAGGNPQRSLRCEVEG